MPLLKLDISPQLVQNIKQYKLTIDVGTGYVKKPRIILSGEERNYKKNQPKFLEKQRLLSIFS